jgi:GTP pyrophosphokinase
VRKAYDIADAAHKDQFRLSGEPFIIHPIEVAYILAELKMDIRTIAAGLLHDTIEDTRLTVSDIESAFGKEIALLVEGVSKIRWLHRHSSHEDKAENLRKMLLAMAEDIRVILIKLADRLHNMRTLEYLPLDNQKKTALETLEIYAPLAHRLGMGRIKWELEDLAFSYLHPAIYREISGLVAAKREERERYIDNIRKMLKEEFDREGIVADIKGRPKHFYSIYQKMTSQHKSFDEIYDLIGIRIITEEIKDCYGALGIVHTKWKPVPGRFKDYIATPKTNMYQSIHTTVIGPNNKPMEVQIRTKGMDIVAEEGIAAHWHYKEGSKYTEKYDSKLVWLKRVIEWQQELTDPREFMENLKLDLFSDEVFVFTPKGQIKSLPKGATPIDFAYSIHTDIGDHCFGAKVNGKMVPLDYNIKNGDIIEIITSPKAHPTRDWLRLVKTPKARSKIRSWIKAQEEEQGLVQSKEDIQHRKPQQPQLQVKAKRTTTGKIIISGEKNLAFHLAKCCGPIPGDEIAGYVTKGGVTIHRKNCTNLIANAISQARIVKANWGNDETSTYEANITARAFDRKNLLKDMLAVIITSNTIINEAWAKSVDNGMARCEFTVLIKDKKHLDEIIHQLEKVRGVVEVFRGKI